MESDRFGDEAEVPDCGAVLFRYAGLPLHRKGESNYGYGCITPTHFIAVEAGGE